MDLNETRTTTCDAPPTEPALAESPKIELRQLPALCWATAVLFGLNLMIACGVAISPELKVDMYGEADDDTTLIADIKPSAFVEPPARPRPVRRAERLRPIVQPVFSPEEEVLAGLMASPVPVVSQTERYVSGDKVYEVIEGQSPFTRQTASLSPRRQADGGENPAPRRTTEPEARHVIVN
jgi:hypothetical protein